MSEIQIEKLDWETYANAAEDICKQITESNYNPNLILAIARGGLFLAGSIGYGLKIKNISVINIELYTGVNQKLEIPMMLPPFLDTNELKDMRILIVDDISDSGETISTVNEYCSDYVADSKTSVLYQKDTSKTQCDYFWKRTTNWIDFPWSEVGQ